MRLYEHILVVIEPKRDTQVALKRAIEIAKFNPKATITALRVVYDFSYDIHILNRLVEKSTREDILETNKKALDEVISEYTKDTDVHVESKVIFAREIAVAITEEANNGKYDLLLKAANHHGMLDAIIFTPIDWYLLRNVKAPVVIAKDNELTNDNSGEYTIAVAVDFTFYRHKKTNLKLLREAQMLAAVTGSKIHLINSVPVVMPTVMLEVPHYAPEIYADSIITEHKKHLLEFAKKHNIPEDQCHIEEGMPDDVLPDLCKKIDAKIVFIGSSGRSGAMAALIGNTCEEIVDQIDADLVVLNDATIQKNSRS